LENGNHRARDISDIEEENTLRVEVGSVNNILMSRGFEVELNVQPRAEASATRIDKSLVVRKVNWRNL
jgi:hypothetical protein